MNKDQQHTKNNSNATEQLTRALEALPSADQFMTALHIANQKTTTEKSSFTVPYLIELHRVVHELLPNPNKGLWEPDLGLDRELLSYFALYYQNNEQLPPTVVGDAHAKTRRIDHDPKENEHDRADQTSHHDKSKQPMLRSKL